MANPLPDVQHLRVQRARLADTDRYTFTTDFGGTAEMSVDHTLDQRQRDALLGAISNIATDLDNFKRNPRPSPAVSLDAHARTLTDQLVPPRVLDLLMRGDRPLLISTTAPAIPWQLVVVGGAPLGLLRPIAIRAILTQRHEAAPPAAAVARAHRSALL